MRDVESPGVQGHNREPVHQSASSRLERRKATSSTGLDETASVSQGLAIGDRSVNRACEEHLAILETSRRDLHPFPICNILRLVRPRSVGRTAV
jgi:hypothetical protein